MRARLVASSTARKKSLPCLHSARVATAGLALLLPICSTIFGQELGSTYTLDQIGRRPGQPEKAAPEIPNFPIRGEGTPALEHRLWMSESSLKPGSAQVHFGRSLTMWNMLAKEQRNEIQQSWGDDIEISLEERREYVKSLDWVYGELHLLAIAEDQRYDLRLKDKSGVEVFTMLLPEIQQSRELARCLGHKFRVQVADGDVEGAVSTLRDGFRLGAFIGQGKTLVQSLVGLAIQAIMLEESLALLELEEVPNMYWAYATLPRPLVNMQAPVEFEMEAIGRVFPIFEIAETEEHDESYWNSQWAKMAGELSELGGGPNQSQRAALALIGVAGGEKTRRRLIESGMDSKRVAAMPLMQAVLIDTSRELKRASQDLLKAQYLPAPLRKGVLERENERFRTWLREETLTSPAAVVAGMLLPALLSVDEAVTHKEYVVNRIMTVEAIRMHAHANGGELPESLDELGPAPALPDPYTGKHFGYSLKKQVGGTLVTLTGGVPDRMREAFGKFQFLLVR